MQAPIKGRKAGKATPQKIKTRHTGGTGSGLQADQKCKRRNDSRKPQKGKLSKLTRIAKAIDSRTTVVERAKRIKIGVPFHETPPGLADALMAIRDSMPGSSAIIQEARLEKALRRWSLTTFEMLKFLDLYDPRARIQGLRLAGHEILRTWVLIETDCGQRHRVGRFTMQRGLKSTLSPNPQTDLFSATVQMEVEA